MMGGPAYPESLPEHEDQPRRLGRGPRLPTAERLLPRLPLRWRRNPRKGLQRPGQLKRFLGGGAPPPQLAPKPAPSSPATLRPSPAAAGGRAGRQAGRESEAPPPRGGIPGGRRDVAVLRPTRPYRSPGRPRFPPGRQAGRPGGTRRGRPPGWLRARPTGHPARLGRAVAGALGAGRRGPARRRRAGRGGGEDEPAAAAAATAGRHRHRQGAERPAGFQRDVLPPREQREGPADHAGEQPVRRGREQLYPSVLDDIEELHETE